MSVFEEGLLGEAVGFVTYDRVVLGTLITPTGKIPAGWVAILDGRISALGSGAPPPARHTDDFGTAFVMPGIVDGQTHAGSYGGLPGIRSTTRSAVAGGVTTIVDMPYDNPLPLTDRSTLEAKVAAVEEHAACDVALYGTVSGVMNANEVAALVEGGVCAFKISGFENHPVRFPRVSSDQTLDLLECLAETDLPIGLHNEDQEIVRSRIARFKALGQTTQEWHQPSRPVAAELAATAHFLELGRVTGAHVHIVHFSVARGYELVARYQAEGTRATAELCVHYLALDAALDGPRLGSRMKVSPPIRAGEREKLWSEVANDRVAFVSSDHSSWPVTSRAEPSIFDAGAGIPGLETLLPLFWRECISHGADAPMLAAQYLAERPARFFGLWPRKGALVPGADADIAIVAEESTLFKAEQLHDELNWSPFDGQLFPIRVIATFVRGSTAYSEGVVVAPAGHGRVAKRQARSAAPTHPALNVGHGQ